MSKLPSPPAPSTDEYFNESLLIEDYPIQVLPKLAVAIGLNENPLQFTGKSDRLLAHQPA